MSISAIDIRKKALDGMDKVLIKELGEKGAINVWVQLDQDMADGKIDNTYAYFQCLDNAIEKQKKGIE